MTEPDPIRCCGGCKSVQDDDDAAMRAGWECLPITSWWRCGGCTRELEAASAIVGMNDETADALAPDSRGALRRETASSISAPVVKG